MNGLGAINYSAMRWSDLMRQAQADHARQWERGIDVFSGGSTVVGGLTAQIYLAAIDPMVSGAPELISPYTELAQRMQTTDAAPWGFPGYDVHLNLKDPAGPDGYMTRLTRGPNDTVAVSYYLINDGFPVGMLTPFLMAAGAWYFGPGAGATTAVTEQGAAVASEVAASEVGAELYANEMAKLLQQQALAQSGVDLLTASPLTVDLSAASLGADLYANETAKLLQQQYLAQSGYDLLPTTLDTIELSAAAGSGGLFTPQQVGSLLNTVKSVTGLVSAISAAGSVTGSRTAPRTTAPTYRTTSPQYGTQYGTPYGQQAAQDDTMLWLGIGAAVLAAVFI